MKLCPRCEEPAAAGHSYCLSCKAEYMREWRKTHPLTPEQRKKDISRSYLGVYVRKGYVTREPCEVCGDEPAEAHHHDYAQPLAVRWLCRPHHLKLHAKDVKT